MKMPITQAVLLSSGQFWKMSEPRYWWFKLQDMNESWPHQQFPRFSSLQPHIWGFFISPVHTLDYLCVHVCMCIHSINWMNQHGLYVQYYNHTYKSMWMAYLIRSEKAPMNEPSEAWTVLLDLGILGSDWQWYSLGGFSSALVRMSSFILLYQSMSFFMLVYVCSPGGRWES